MKNSKTTTLWVGILIAVAILLLQSRSTSAELTHDFAVAAFNSEVLKMQALEILETKCNVCHRKQNPLMIFKEKNLEKRAAKIYSMVFIERRMPKAGGAPLTSEEYATLEKWLNTQNIK